MPMQKLPNCSFRASVLASDAGHERATLGLGQNINHSMGIGPMVQQACPMHDLHRGDAQEAG